MGSHLWKRSDSLTQPNSSLEKLTREEEVTQDGGAPQRGREKVKLTQGWQREDR